MTYIYAADVFCDDCAEKIKDAITAEGKAPADPDDEYSYDSDEFPKGPFGSDESDSPQHCGAHDDCVNAIELSDGKDSWKIGVWLENDLTTDGIDYVKEAVAEGGEVAELWAEYYNWIDFPDPNAEAADEAWEHCLDLEERAAHASMEACVENAGSYEYADKLGGECASAFAEWDALYGDAG